MQNNNETSSWNSQRKEGEWYYLIDNKWFTESELLAIQVYQENLKSDYVLTSYR